MRQPKKSASLFLFSVVSTITLRVVPGAAASPFDLAMTDRRLEGLWVEDPILIHRPNAFGDLPTSSIQALSFKGDTFSVTWQPICTYKDYWGKAVCEKHTGFINLVVKGGNYVPNDFVGRGRYRLHADGTLTITGVSFGTKANGKPHARYVFRRASR